MRNRIIYLIGLLLAVPVMLLAQRVAVVSKSGKYGLATADGNVVVPMTYSYISAFNRYGVAWISQGGSIRSSDGKKYVKNGKIGLVNDKGEILIAPTYKALCEFTDHTKWNKQKIFGEAVLMDPVGHLLTDTLKTDCLYLGFTDDDTTARNAGVMDQKGNVVVNANVYTWVSLPKNGFMRFWNFVNNTTAYGYVKLDTRTSHTCETLNIKSDNVKAVTHGDYVGNLAPVNSIHGWYFLDKSFNLTQKGFKIVNYVTLGTKAYLMASRTDGSMMYDCDGRQMLSSTSFDRIGTPWCVGDNGLNIPVEKNERWGVVDANGKIIIPMEYSLIKYPKGSDTDNIWCGSVGDTIFVNYNVKKGPLPEKYTYVSAFRNGYAAVNPLKPGTTNKSMYPNKRIIIDTNNRVVVSEPFPRNLSNKVLKFVVEHDGNVTRSLQRELLLKLSRGSQRYSLTEILPSTAWDY